MTWPEFESIMVIADGEPLPDSLLAHQLAGEGKNPYYNLLRRLCMAVKEPGVFLEIGCYHGTVAAHVADAFGYHNHEYLGVDVNEVPFIPHPACRFIQGDSTDAQVCSQVKAFAETHGGIFCVFQDSSHHYEASVAEWALYSPLVRPGGLWLADDITPAFQRPGLDAKSMVGYWDDLPADKKTYDHLHIGSRIGVALL